MVAAHYASLGFSRVELNSGDREVWQYDMPPTYSARTRYIFKIAQALPTAANA